MSVQNILDSIAHITGGHKKFAKFVANSFFDTMDELDTEKVLVDLHMLDGSSVCRKEKNIEGFLSHSVMYCWSRAYLQ